MSLKVRRIKAPWGEFLQIIIQNGVILKSEEFSSNGTIDLGIDRIPLSIELHDYEKNPRWTITQEVIDRYQLNQWVEDLKSVKQVWFSKGKKTILGTDLRTEVHDFE